MTPVEIDALLDPVFPVAVPLSAVVFALFAAAAAVASVLAERAMSVAHYGVTLGQAQRALRRRLQSRTLGNLRRLFGGLNFAAIGALVLSPWSPWATERTNDGAIQFAVVFLLAFNGYRLFFGRGAFIPYFGSVLLALLPIAMAFGSGALFISVADDWIDPLFQSSVTWVSGLALVGGVVITLIIVGLVWLISTALLWDVRQALAEPQAALARRTDKRQPLVFLRSFEDDQVQFRGWTRTLENKRVEKIDTDLVFEEEIARELREYGPFVAIGQPGTRAKRGAARAFVDDSNWQSEVAAWMDEAAIIILVAGHTEGLRWELTNAIQRGLTHKLVFLFQPFDPHHNERIRWLQHALRDHPIAHALDRVASETLIALHLDRRGDVVAFTSQSNAGNSYVAALVLALYGKVAPDLA